MGEGPPAGNLPREANKFVGRQGELSEIRQLLSTARLVTLTGFGGVGKSRLALRAAADLRGSFADGVWLTELADVRDHSLVPHAVSRSLGITGGSAQDQNRALTRYLAARRVLLVLDNCEHVSEAVAVLVAELLSTGRRLRVLATSRATLRIFGERTYRVNPLPVSGPGVIDKGNDAQPSAAVALFVDRAAAAAPGFAFTADNAPQVAVICERMEGVPLAIELAAAQLQALPLHQLVARLDDRFALLTSVEHNGLPRHRTLWAAVQWSYELCTGPERLLWARASIFADRFTLDAAERVCAGNGLPADDVLDALSGLIDKSVLFAEPDDEQLRYRQLDTVRQFGLDRLRHPDGDREYGPHHIGEPELRRRHRDFYVNLAEQFDTDWFGDRQVQWTRRMRGEVANFRAALGFCLTDDDHPEVGTRLAGALYYYWYGCGETREGRYWLEQTLAADPRPGRDRTRALAALARLLILQGLPAAALEPARRCLRFARQLGDPFYESHALHTLGLGLTYTGDPTAGQALLEEAVARAGELGTQHPATAFTKFALATAAMLHGDPVRASRLYAECRAISRAHDERWWLGIVLTAAVVPALLLGDLIQAREYGRQSLQMRQALHDTHGTASSLTYLAYVAAAAQEYPRAARLLGAADRHWHTAGGSPFAAGPLRRLYDDYRATTWRALGEAAYQREFRRGRRLTLAEAASYALDHPAPADGTANTP